MREFDDHRQMIRSIEEDQDVQDRNRSRDLVRTLRLVRQGTGQDFEVAAKAVRRFIKRHPHEHEDIDSLVVLLTARGMDIIASLTNDGPTYVGLVARKISGEVSATRDYWRDRTLDTSH